MSGLPRLILPAALACCACVAPGASAQTAAAPGPERATAAAAAPAAIRIDPAPAAAKIDPAEILRAARSVYVNSGTTFFEAGRLRHELRKRADFAAWQMEIVDDGRGGGEAAAVGQAEGIGRPADTRQSAGIERRAGSEQTAGIEIEIDRPLFTHTFTYKLTDRRTSIVLAAGDVTGWDGDDAAPKLAQRIAEEIGRVRRRRRPAPVKKNASKEGRRRSRDAGGARVGN